MYSKAGRSISAHLGWHFVSPVCFSVVRSSSSCLSLGWTEFSGHSVRRRLSLVWLDGLHRPASSSGTANLPVSQAAFPRVIPLCSRFPWVPETNLIGNGTLRICRLLSPCFSASRCWRCCAFSFSAPFLPSPCNSSPRNQAWEHTNWDSRALGTTLTPFSALLVFF